MSVRASSAAATLLSALLAAGSLMAAEGWSQYGPVTPGQTLTRIADSILPGGRQDSAAYYRLLGALYLANREAMPEGVRSLQVGATLQVPPAGTASPETALFVSPGRRGAAVAGGTTMR